MYTSAFLFSCLILLDAFIKMQAPAGILEKEQPTNNQEGLHMKPLLIAYAGNKGIRMMTQEDARRLTHTLLAAMAEELGR